MLIRFVRASGSCIVAILAFTVSVRAEQKSPNTAVLWYRSMEGCPDGPSFLGRVGDRAALVRLAEAGDRVDFVVNLLITPEGARGRLERETDQGTVAIREVEDASCDRVADVVALNLALALDPERSESTVADASPAPAAAAASAQAELGSKGESPHARAQLRAVPPERSAPVRVSEPAENRAAPAPPTLPPRRWWLGLQAGLLGGVTPELMAKGAVFAELDDALGPWLPGATLRAAVVGATGSTETHSGAVGQSLWAGHFEVCPLRLGGPTLSAAPCAAGEVGQLKASAEYRASSVWSALGAHARGRWVVGGSLAAEAQLGALFPLSRYDVSAGSTVLYRSATAGISAAVGLSVGF